ncbi:hypothetical protein CEXT_65471 [Caerostris extrusa]|uniref:Uncharacterized protein n=1 Tax=Caerostris extrusa TaxID=172846 RepID=A0AAV4V450_CAEEX|nr:hypothetical protein CEXT_65471 [Caerostris extrusa]
MNRGGRIIAPNDKAREYEESLFPEYFKAMSSPEQVLAYRMAKRRNMGEFLPTTCHCRTQQNVPAKRINVHLSHSSRCFQFDVFCRIFSRASFSGCLTGSNEPSTSSTLASGLTESVLAYLLF